MSAPRKPESSLTAHLPAVLKQAIMGFFPPQELAGIAQVSPSFKRVIAQTPFNNAKQYAAMNIGYQRLLIAVGLYHEISQILRSPQGLLALGQDILTTTQANEFGLLHDDTIKLKAMVSEKGLAALKEKAITLKQARKLSANIVTLLYGRDEDFRKSLFIIELLNGMISHMRFVRVNSDDPAVQDIKIDTKKLIINKVLSTNDNFDFYVNTLEHFILMLNSFSEHAAEILNKVLSDINKTKKIFNYGLYFNAMLLELPQHTETIIDWLLKTPAEFSRIMTDIKILGGLANISPKHTKPLINTLFHSVETFKKLVEKRNRLIHGFIFIPRSRTNNY